MHFKKKYPIPTLRQSSYGNSFLQSPRPSLPSSSPDGVTLGNSSLYGEAFTPISLVPEHFLLCRMQSSFPATYRVLGLSPITE
jgi:hypothetical protein